MKILEQDDFFNMKRQILYIFVFGLFFVNSCEKKPTDNRISVVSLSLDYSVVALYPGQSLKLTVTVNPDSATDTSVKWSSKDESIATVSSDGVVSAIAEGTAVITVASNDGDKKAECTVAVYSEMIQMTTNKPGYFGFFLRGTGMAIVDWGDGSANEAKELSTASDIGFNHNYSRENARIIRVFGDIDITHLECRGHLLSQLNVSNCSNLVSLNCNKNDISNLDLSKNTKLRILRCNENRFSNLDLSKNTALTELDCSINVLLKSLDVRKQYGVNRFIL